MSPDALGATKDEKRSAARYIESCQGGILLFTMAMGIEAKVKGREAVAAAAAKSVKLVAFAQLPSARELVLSWCVALSWPAETRSRLETGHQAEARASHYN